MNKASHRSNPREPISLPSQRPAVGMYLESTRSEQLSLLPGEVRQVKDVMTTRVTTATPRTSLMEAAGLMRKLDVPVVMVYDGACLKGMLTERDMGLSPRIRNASPKAVIERVMRTSIPTCCADDLLIDALDVMRAAKLKWLPVLDRQQRLLGVLSADAAES